MLHRPLVFAGAALLALLLAVPAFAVRVHVRVEGANATIFGPTEPSITPVAGTFTPPEGAAVTLNADTAFGALERASRIGEVYYRVQATGFGPYVDRIGRLASTGTSGWVYKVNGVSPPVGADQYRLRQGDRVLWYHATFGPSGGPKTIDLRRRSRNCYRAVLRDDQGKATTAPIVFHVDARRVRDSDGAVCLSGHWHTVRATAAGAVRSRVLHAPRRFRHR